MALSDATYQGAGAMEGESIPAAAVGRYDVIMFAAAAVIMTLGVILVFSTTARPALGEHDALYFLKRHVMNLAIGAGAFLAALRMPPRWLSFMSKALLPVSILLLGLVLVPGIGVERGGARRWFLIPGTAMTVQPAEIAKVAFALYLASYLEKRWSVLNDLVTGIVPLAGAYLVVAMLLLVQPDVGSAVLLGLLVVAMLFVGGARLSILGSVFLVGVAGLVVVMIVQPEKLARFIGWILPDQTRLGEGYQIFNSQILIGAGGMLGSGLGKGLHHMLGFLPASENDFIFSVAAEEGGLFMVVALVALYALIAVRGFSLARRCGDTFTRFAAFALTLLLSLPALIHMAVGLGLLPTKGLVAPFLSYGGSAVVAELFTLGLIERFHRDASAVSNGNGGAAVT